MRVLISGGLGFLGRAAGGELQADGHAVRLMDVRDRDALEIDYFRGSVLKQADCKAACAGIDTVVHGAAVHEARRVARDPLAAIAINVRGTINLFRSARAAGARRFVFLSSAKVYGDTERLPSVEDDPLEAKETYALSKVAGEHHLWMNVAGSGMQVVVIRPFSVYGPGQDLGSGYVGMVLQSVLGDHNIVLPGTEEYRRDFVHIDDVTRLLVAAITADSLPDMTVLNVGSGTSVSLGELVAQASEIVGRQLPIGFKTPGPETLTRSHACIERSAQLLGYRPHYQLRSGLANTFDWFMTAAQQRELDTQ